MKKISLIFIILFISICAFGRDFSLTLLDVGQGLSCVVISPDNHCLVFDCGTIDSSKYKTNMGIFDRTLDPYLRENGINKIDYLVLSHPNTDHYSGFPHLINTYSVGTYIKNGFSADNYYYNELQKALAKKHLKAKIARYNNVFYLGKEVKCKILSPMDNIETEDDNDQSVMIRVEYKNNSFILTGDISAKGERKVSKRYKTQLKSDVLVVAHHGSKYSSTYEFLNAVRPKVSLISCGKNNRYGHPHADTLKRLKNVGSKVYRTDTMGGIKCVFKNNKLIITKYKKNNNLKFAL